MSAGALGKRSQINNDNWRIQSVAPQVFFSLAVALPIGLGVRAWRLAISKKSEWS
jgi:hypothetical protein